MKMNKFGLYHFHRIFKTEGGPLDPPRGTIKIVNSECLDEPEHTVQSHQSLCCLLTQNYGSR